MVLQQLAQDRQSVFCHISMSAERAIMSSLRGGSFSIFERKRLRDDLFPATFLRKSRRLILSMSSKNKEDFFEMGFNL